MARVLLAGIETASAAQLSRILAVGGHSVRIEPRRGLAADLYNVDIVFAGGGSADYLPLMRRVRTEQPEMPFVVVTRVPETTEWLDALEAGATDYCSAPFETHHIEWLMESALQSRSLLAVA